MSIPPLVCSSPPPPEQCEDEKEPEDYDFQYHSQLEDEDSASYTYDNFSTDTIYKIETESIQNLKNSENIEKELLSNRCPSLEFGGNFVNSNTVTCDNLENVSDLQEDSILEDLNLEVTAGNLQTNITNDEGDIENNIDNIDDCKVANIQDEGGTDAVQIESEDIKSFSQPTIDEDMRIIDSYSVEISYDNSKEFNQEIISTEISVESQEKANEVIYAVELENGLDTDLQLSSINDDDFGDFDCFQHSNQDATYTESHSILNSENPWEDKLSDSQSDFGEFTANFDNDEEPSKIISDSVINIEDIETKESNDDDFDDFDDFQSSNNKSTYPKSNQTEEKDLSCTNVLNFPTSDNELQIIENINNVLESIFTEDLAEPIESTNVKLELNLGETWGHLMDTDTRQPYMVNWNNTLGQKSLLKALCIDSRNILFGARWNYNMPKYAANLSTSPLQPQKQLGKSNVDNNVQSAEKDVNTWTDPFTPHGQDYTYAEALLLDLEHLMATLDQMAHKHSTLKISELLSHACSNENKKPVANDQPKSLDGFTTDIPPSINKIYSSTLSVQPIRQISLPDTHIFTPTDSETPRSKTIHYDTEHRSLSNFETAVSQDELPESNNANEVSTKKDNEYWEFQHFKGSSSTITNNPHAISLTTLEPTENKTYGTQILQPIKLEPVIPTLNWPDPGEVKEAYLDFSDFVSSATSNNISSLDSGDEKSPIKNIKEIPKLSQPLVESNDDEFEIFQSAGPLSSQPSNTASNPKSDSKTLNTQFDNMFKKINNNDSTKVGKHDEIKAIDEISNKEIINISNYVPDSQSSQVINPIITHVNPLPTIPPTNINFIRNQQSCGQILQPLSLEGFSQINWPNPGIDLHDLSRFNPIESVHSLKSESGTSGHSKVSTPVHNSTNITNNDVAADDDIWGDFVSGAPKPQNTPKKTSTFGDDDEWSDFVSSPSVKPQNGLNTISLNVQTNLNLQKSASHIKYPNKNNPLTFDIPALNYITPKSSSRGVYAEKHVQNL